MPRVRIVGIVYLSYALVSGLGDFLVKRVVIAGDPMATAANLLAHEPVYRAGLAFGLLANVLYLVLTLLFYRLFVPVDRIVSLLMASFGLVGCTTQIVGGLLQLAPLALLRDTQLASAFQPAQVRAAALMCLRIYSQVYSISFVLFALFDFALGTLIVRSTFLPRALGVLMLIAGVAALTFLYPPFPLAYKWVVLPICGGPEALLMLWLLVKGVDVARWKEGAAAPDAAVAPVAAAPR